MALSLSGFLAACGGGGDGESSGDGGESSGGGSETWRMVTEEVDGQVQYEYAEEFGKRINEKTDGQITIEPYEFGGLGNESDQVEQLETGAVEMAVMSPGFTGNMVKEGQLFALHFLFPDSVEKTQEVLNKSEALNKDLRSKYEEHGITPLAFWSEGAMQWTSSKKIEKPEDFEGLKMRTQTSPLILESYKAYGADPQSMSWGELYTALDRGTVEGQENPIFFIGDASFHEVQDYMTLSNHNNYVAMTTVNSDWYDGLDEEMQKTIDETVQEMQEWVYEEQEAQNEEWLKTIKEDEENATEVIELTEEQREAFRKEAMGVRDFYREEVSTVDGEILDKLEKEISEISGEETGESSGSEE
ncbi:MULTISPECIES: DctP family TRAP transporter solute-binding subunit [Salimicrobium]|uniref:C4-dicarboxylate ABC transporter n=1 Tax=Salimicrobium humidisoli TaxID=2029857 RepID=A0ABX4HNV6_9BACI|nr:MULTISPECIES: DctP family TRAP transporter solute-binding subunit [Salimicrobium]PBB04879.1 C4-dicarboxylate ABC transporter [Salimicrobium humidisoli]